MRARRDAQIEAIRLRVEEGLSITAIAKTVAASKSSVSEWLRCHPAQWRAMTCRCGRQFSTNVGAEYCGPACGRKYRNDNNRDRWANDEEYRERKKKQRLQVKLEVFTHYCGGLPRCQCPSGLCTESILEFLTLDHIENDGAKDRSGQRGAGLKTYLRLKREGYPPGFRILCWNCNCGRAKTPGRRCPHELYGVQALMV